MKEEILAKEGQGKNNKKDEVSVVGSLSQELGAEKEGEYSSLRRRFGSVLVVAGGAKKAKRRGRKKKVK